VVLHENQALAYVGAVCRVAAALKRLRVACVNCSVLLTVPIPQEKDVVIDFNQADVKTFQAVLKAALLASPTIGHSFYMFWLEKQLRRHHASVHNRCSSGRSCGCGLGDSRLG
jgi:hypothetical protein